MPRYTNSGSSDAFIGGYTIQPGKYQDILGFYTDLPTGVTQTAAAPVWNPVLVSEISPGNTNDVTTVTLPSVSVGGDGGYVDISLNCLAGSATVYFNDQVAFTPPLLMVATEWTVIRTTLDKVGSVIVKHTASSSSVKVDVFRR